MAPLKGRILEQNAKNELKFSLHPQETQKRYNKVTKTTYQNVFLNLKYFFI